MIIKLSRAIAVSLVSLFLFTDTEQIYTWNFFKPELKFNSDGSFKIVQFTDIQDGADVDKRTIRLMEKVMDGEKPNFIVITGDITDGRCRSLNDVKKAIANIARPIEKRKIPWAIVFGNHDEEHKQISKKEMMKIYLSYPNNISKLGPENISGIGNYNIIIKNSQNSIPIFNLYFLDSGEYAPENIGGYDWIKPSQIHWYEETAQRLRKKYDKIIPSLMFFHIPLPEWKEVWRSGRITGKKNEEVQCSKINGGMFAALLEMKDVIGVFVGHDHTNDYMGELFGVKLGYCRSIGYGTYGKKGIDRGARVFLINESNPTKFETWMRLESDFK